jgi:cytochrome P450
MDPVTAFDPHDPALPETWPQQHATLRSKCPVAHSSQQGGFYAVSRYSDAWTAVHSHEVFSSRNDVSSESIYKGVLIPPSFVQAGIIEMDPPEWGKYRAIPSRLLAPRAVESRRSRSREIARWAIDQVVESGRIDLCNDLAAIVPSIVTLELVGAPIDNWKQWSEAFHRYVYLTPPDPGYDENNALLMELVASLDPAIDRRREEPRDDLISAFVTTEVDGRRLTNEEIRFHLFPLIAGGLDTTATLSLLAFHHLSRSPRDRERLLTDPSLLPLATEEFLRYCSPVQGEARTVARDSELNSTQFKEGDRVFLLYASANRDEEQFPEADKFILDRTPNRHLAFGSGIHRCLGSNLARMEFQEILAEVLERIPDFEVIESETRRYPSIGSINGYVSMTATFTPGERKGPSDLPGLSYASA